MHAKKFDLYSQWSLFAMPGLSFSLIVVLGDARNSSLAVRGHKSPYLMGPFSPQMINVLMIGMQKI